MSASSAAPSGKAASGGEAASRKAASREGETALVLGVPEAEPLVRPWRQREIGLPAHVTVLTPFLPAPRIDDGVRRALRALFMRYPAVDVTFREIRRFAGEPGVVFLAPEPAKPFVRLTEAVTGRWPGTPPYGGRYDEIVPHLTLGEDGAVDEAWVAGELPVTARVTAVSLLVRDAGGHWRPADVFPLA
ncbi:2'-5' RNA ligase family protein [Nonomuraea sp. FMUSA5-5]|uniref:2'-5' RNA ligase family protein n=1 Tax=Nonomuraea composti TaxID=2720023 RepID=A0ABX1ATS5_9ACTN|nr:2'-5' RNA ligase family protein [Nonomuraea sp. FMUSA5-5]NJP89018.1 2'-5' RNA ligase family protein [Nonomuraea sp. FMUSA5-5]